MPDILSRALSEALQAFVPVAFWAVWVKHRPDPALHRVSVAALVFAIALSPVAGDRFRSTSYQAVWELVFALATAAVVMVFLARSRDSVLDVASPRAGWRRTVTALVVFGAVTLVVLRQTMEIAAVALIAFDLRSDAVVPLAIGTAIGAAAAVVAWMILRRLETAALRRSVTAAAWVFLGEVLFYAFHEAAEARLLPFSDGLHAATEPYGPDGMYGRYATLLVLAAPVMAAAWVGARHGAGRATRRRAAFGRYGVIAFALAVVITAAAVALVVRGKGSIQSDAALTANLQPLLQQPHVLFRHTALDRAYGHVAVAPLTGGSGRGISALSCERLAYAAGHGICLAADRGVFTTFQAVLFDAALNRTGTLKLTGSPSRARVAPDGRVGVFTVFVSGDGYTTTTFSTRTMLVDMDAGDVLADLENFTVWRDGKRIRSADFNFWGVTFARDSNTFYATLKTAGIPYLVRGDLRLRRLTVLRDGVECPAISPDDKTIAFKKKVGTAAGAWRIYLLDPVSLADRPLPGETRFVDDQVEWLDAGHVLYGIPRPNSGAVDVFVAPIDGSAAPSVFIAEAASPAVVR